MVTHRRKGGSGPPQKPPPRIVDRSSFDADKKKIKVEKLYHKANNPDNDWPFSFGSVFKMLLSIRISGAIWGIINDCDEVYNYWEPLHLFLYGEGFQTWEYSPVYAIRSYFYIYLHYIPASLFANLFGDTKIVVFTLIRLTIGLFCLLGEYYAFDAICKKINIATGRFFILFSIFSSGMFLASTAFVPSSFCMAITFYILGAYLNENWTAGIFCVAFSTMVGWPFSAVLGLPIVADMLLLKGLRIRFILTSLVIGLCIGGVQVITDSHYFGKTVLAPLNIFLYNVVSGPGPSLYGEEPLSFYIKNLFNNWNIVIFAAPFGFPLSLAYFTKVWMSQDRNVALYQRFAPIILLAVTTAAWLLIFGSQAHKEERFLFPIYPFIAFFAALALDATNRLCLKKLGMDNILSILFILCFAILSASRTYSIHNNYGSHVEIYRSLNAELTNRTNFKNFHDPIRVCVGKEWHRFPSSFFIPQTVSDGKKVEMRFIQSEFRGLLPKPFLKSDKLVEVTRHIPTEMNNLNQEEISRYVDLDSCDYVVDVDMPQSDREPDFRKMEDNWKPVDSLPFIDVSKSTGFHGLLRAFYVPFLSAKHNVMTTCTLYRKSNL
ncbi:Alpha-1,2-mannosyltransferase algn-9 [Caenorhabditis elegans]|uniref:Alpha-1,2-mannosyltransferase algn-9 n=1 Tax=Caenorhabditis elegans TaxID=6239 RepID=ALG9_CAEEL|nr:Alpha-1,2-mannosyltransferase algn-9 [Caenorhabditis elegans]P54002.2 RecName: Full=Alpha-1,2-mannosyltransferase algn-9; AltName: Full=Asparagine-linked glycosylation protein 9 homolog; AltName: Full=Dol-P-Man:Man(6)GlcNAc(2)-PP-Dol alpha-1,2-mannosyltransferase; AltName: Full=Dol-P-Man:Man(8)GlcNAc(2)-PP-Dol alpha-1,2-mannosyltransferase [Caenorhabditis elegans]CAA90107.2 Alpha-1,2-mannosyltransferase algn-9 [Caenorhabditis elegans]|eukprot:NP_496282.2 Putative glycosyltransferase C14A4.3 [Caenorhabditis elegans]